MEAHPVIIHDFARKIRFDPSPTSEKADESMNIQDTMPSADHTVHTKCLTDEALTFTAKLRSRQTLMNLFPVTFSIFLVLGGYLPYLDKGEIVFADIQRALILTPLFTSFLWLIFYFFFRDWKQSAILSWFMLVALFTSTYQYKILSDLAILDTQEQIWILLFGLWFGTIGLVYLLRQRLRRLTDIVFKMLSYLGIFFLCVPLFSILIHDIQSRIHHTRFSLAASPQEMAIPLKDMQNAGETYPHIVYMILDGYGRGDVLKEIYGFDNSKFLNTLEKKGFYIAQKSHANYAQTVLSLASSLNFDYLNEIPHRLGIQSEDKGPVRDLIQHSRAVSILRQHGYKIAAFSSGISFTELRDADTFMSHPLTLNEWESFYLMRTPIPAASKALYNFTLQDAHKARLFYTFEHLPTVIHYEQPHFVFAHFVAPHPPFVLGKQPATEKNKSFSFRDGSHYRKYYRATSGEYIASYTKQLQALNEQIEKTIEKILVHSERPVVIIIQGDHGPGAYVDWEDPSKTIFKERLSILNAFFIPNGDKIGLYAGMTPVNSFRILFNHYFHSNIPLLEDRSFFSTMKRPYDFIPITDMNKNFHLLRQFSK